MKRRPLFCPSITMMCLAVACTPSNTPGDPIATGKVQVFLEPEDNITGGMDPGTQAGSLSDGWTVRYQKFQFTFGRFDASQSSAVDQHLKDDRVFAVDFLRLTAANSVILTFDSAAATRWDRVSYETPRADDQTVAHSSITAADLAEMKAGRLSALIEGTMTKTGGQSCRPTAAADCVPRETHRFRYEVAVGQRYGQCGPEEGDSGFAVPSGGSVQIKPTFHGDHFFLSNFASHSAALYAQYVADADLNRDGLTTLEELGSTAASDLFPSPKYNLSAFPEPISTGRDYVEQAVRTMGHFQGEGECPDRSRLP